MLLIQPEWPARALLKAELEERGYDVLGADSMELALDLSMKRGFKPDVVVVDLSGLALGQLTADRLTFFRGRAPLLVIGSRQLKTPDLAALAPARELPRPVTVGEIADAVAELAKHRA